MANPGRNGWPYLLQLPGFLRVRNSYNVQAKMVDHWETLFTLDTSLSVPGEVFSKWARNPGYEPSPRRGSGP